MIKKKMKLLITGGAGFIGSAVVRQAIANGFEVMNLDVLTYAANLNNLKDISNKHEYSFERIDICNRQQLEQIFSNYKPDAIMHLAAESHVDRSIDTPDDFIKTNIIGTYNMLEVSRSYWLKKGKPKGFRFLHISTDEVFGSLSLDQKEKFTEKTSYDPRSPYSATKASSDHLVRAWHETFSFPALITNCSNNYGPYHHPEKLIPLMIINALFKRPLPIYGNGENIRDWLYVKDHANALLEVLKHGKIGRSYNIGGENEVSNIEIVQKICTILNKKRPSEKPYEDLITFTDDRPGHDQRYAVDPSRIRNELGWAPSVTLDEGLELTVQWYLDNENWWKDLQTYHNIGHRLGLVK